MARRNTSFDEAKIARFVKEGRGQGRGTDYKPWLTIQDVPSCGREHRSRGLKTGRIHHLLSDIEWRLFLHLDWCDEVIDIREQFPLDREKTQRIAEDLGIKHPQDVTSKVPLVMTTDFVVDVDRDGRVTTMARAVKPAKDLDKPRTVEKLEIERRYWTVQGVDWAIVTERDFSLTVARNIEWVHGFASLSHLHEPWEGYFAEKSALILRELAASPDLTLRRFCDRMDQTLAMEAGGSLALVRHLVAIKTIRADMSLPLDDRVPVSRFQISAPARARSAGA